MKCFSYILLNLTIVLKLITTEEGIGEQYIKDICTDNNGNIEILEAFPWKGSLFIIGQNGKNYRIEDFKWNRTTYDFSVGNIQIIGNWNWTSKIRLTFPIEYPGKGLRVIAIKLDKADDIQQLIGYLIDLDAHSGVKSKEELNINIYKAGNKSEPLNFVTFFVKFPHEDLENHLLSVSSYPPHFGRLPRRLFAYYKETPTKSKQKDCIDCYRVKRYVFIARNITYGDNELTEINWHIDNTTNKRCEDLNGLIINASFALTRYFAGYGEGDNSKPSINFDWIELFGTQFNVFRVTITETNGLEDMKIIKTDSIGTIFGCQQSPSTTTESYEYPNDEPKTEESQPPEEQTTERTDEQTTEGTEEPLESFPESSKNGKESKSIGFVILIIIIIVILIIVIIGVIVWFLLRNQSTTHPSGSQPPALTPVAPTPEPQTTPENTRPTADISEAMITPTPVETKTISTD